MMREQNGIQSDGENKTKTAEKTKLKHAAPAIDSGNNRNLNKWLKQNVKTNASIKGATS